MFDAIVVGARCAGAPTAMLLARRGHKVLLVDRAKFPSDVLHSTLLIHQPGSQLLRDWGVLDEVIATGCPPIRSFHAIRRRRRRGTGATSSAAATVVSSTLTLRSPPWGRAVP